jgi:ubiquinone/menaquinone biosynthesis C-methylase UbiE
MRRAAGVLEHLDRSPAPPDLPGYLDDLHRLNAWFAGYALTVRHVRRLLAGADPARTVVLVDVGGGRADLAARLLRDLRRRGHRARVLVVDRDAESLAMGRRAHGADPGLVFVRADASALPLRSRSADVVTMTLTLHHLEPEAAVPALGEMRAAARRGVVVNDLLRSALSYGLVWLATRLFARHPSARHDGPLSVQRAYDERELRGLAARAGFRRLAVTRYPAFVRLIATGG